MCVYVCVYIYTDPEICKPRVPLDVEVCSWPWHDSCRSGEALFSWLRLSERAWFLHRV